LIESRTTRRFREAYANLPEEIRRQARQAYSLFRKDPRHPRLRFKKVDEESNTFSIRIGLGYRALGVMEGSTIIWFWIGSHADYDRLI
jgi:mRNA-degrading endonuclease RelE of RelBE toxin-antitoxin system